MPSTKQLTLNNLHIGMRVNESNGTITCNDNASSPLPVSPPPIARDEMDEDAFNAYMQRGYDAALAGQSLPAADVFKQEMSFSALDENGFTPAEASELKRRCINLESGHYESHELIGV